MSTADIPESIIRDLRAEIFPRVVPAEWCNRLADELEGVIQHNRRLSESLSSQAGVGSFVTVPVVKS